MATEFELHQAEQELWFDAGYRSGKLDRLTKSPKIQQQFYDLTPHDLDTLAMGIALVVLHADSVQTIEATMSTQQKLGLAEKVLGTLHLIATQCGLYHPFVPLHETDPNPWLDRTGREEWTGEDQDLLDALNEDDHADASYEQEAPDVRY